MHDLFIYFDLPLKWQRYAQTRTGTAVKRFQKDSELSICGNHAGSCMVPWPSLKAVIATTTTIKNTASATATAEVYLNESATM